MCTTGRHQLSSFLMPVSMPNYYQMWSIFQKFSYRCDEHAIFYEQIEQDVNY
jgi:hypothetical protein